MIITRGDITIELTPEELYQAYLEQEHLLDVEDVRTFADLCDDHLAGQPYIDLIRDPDVADEVAKLYRTCRNDDNDESWFNDMSYAVMTVGGRITRGAGENT